MKKKFSFYFGIVPFLMAVVILFSFSFLLSSCSKDTGTGKQDSPEEKVEQIESKLLTVARVLEKEGGKSVEVWFYETPLIHDLNKDLVNQVAAVQLLKDAKTRNEPVRVNVSSRQIDKIIALAPASVEEIEAQKKNRSLAQQAIEAENPANQRNTTLVGSIPNMSVLNTIFNGCAGGSACTNYGPYLSGQCIPYQFVADGCYARAHKMRQVIEGFYGYLSYKVFHFLDLCNPNPGSLRVNASLWGNNCCQRWWYHVAPYVYVGSGFSYSAYVIDPSMFTGPVSIETWRNAMRNPASCSSGPVYSGLAYYQSAGYAPYPGYPFGYDNCSISVYADYNYNHANSTCANYARLRGCR